MSNKKKCVRAIDDKGLENVSGGYYTMIKDAHGGKHFELYDNSGNCIGSFPRTSYGRVEMSNYARQNNIDLQFRSYR